MQRDRWVGWLSWAALAALAVAVGLQKIRAYDYWWHLRSGQLIAETGRVPMTDPFSYTAPGAPWIDIHWLFQLALHAVHSLGGHEGVVVAKTVLVVGVLAACGAIGGRRGREALSLLALGLMLLVSATRFHERPELPSFLLLALLLLLLDREESRKGPADRWLWLAIPIQLVWVNMHGLFVLGIVLCGSYLVGELLRPRLRSQPLRRERVQRFAILTFVVTALSLVNPNGLDAALYPLQQLGMIGTAESRGLLGSRIAELLPPVTAGGVQQPLLVGLCGALGALCVAAMLLNARAVAPAHVLLFGAFGFLALSASRNLALFAIVVAPLAVRNGNEFLDRRPLPGRVLVLANIALVLSLGIATWDVAAGRFFARLDSIREPGLGLQDGVHALGAVEWIRRERPAGPICHHMAFGGLLIATLYPDYRAMLDGRLEVYGEDRFADLVVEGPKEFEALDERYRFGAILVHHSLRPPGGLLWSLHVSRAWRLVQVDEIAALFVRVGGEDSRDWPELDLDDPGLFPDVDGAFELTDLNLRRARAYFFLSLRRFERALAELEEMLERHPSHSEFEGARDGLRAQIARDAVREAALRAYVRKHGEEPGILSRLGDLRLARGDVDEARRLYDRALALDPHHPGAVRSRAALAEQED